MNFSGQNINRVNAIKQLQKALNELEVVDIDNHELSLRSLRVQGSIANACIYIGDCLTEINEYLKEDHILDRELV